MLVEWHFDPLYIMENWTEELLHLMVQKMADRKDREASASRGEGNIGDATGPRAGLISGVAYTPKEA